MSHNQAEAAVEAFAEKLIEKLEYAACLATMDEQPSDESYAEARALREVASCVRQALREIK